MDEADALLAFQAELDAIGPPEHFTSIRRTGHLYGGESVVVQCVCGYWRILATFGLGAKLAKVHERDGREF